MVFQTSIDDVETNSKKQIVPQVADTNLKVLMNMKITGRVSSIQYKVSSIKYSITLNSICD